MNFVTTAILGATLFAATTAAAQPLRVNDIHFIDAARCQGLITSSDLGPAVNPTGINRFMDIERAGRGQLALDQADEARRRAKREAATAGPDERAQLVALRDGHCRSYRIMGAHASAGQLTGTAPY